MEHEKLNYVEFASANIAETKAFFEQVFSWKFTDYGDEYTAFSDQGLDGGFYHAPLASESEKGGALLVFYSERLDETLDKIREAGGSITKPTFEFPGGKRFHFTEPCGNEFAVWSDK